jgi:indoleamine 2,3-dioxygenase
MNFQKWKSHYPDSWFSVSPGENGFLPIDVPLKKLPQDYCVLEEILENMKILQKDGSKGYIATCTLKDHVNEKLPNYLSTIKNESNIQIIACLFRDYCFLASAYSLESSHTTIKDTFYEKACDIIPESISEPLLFLSKKVDVYPWLDYAYGYGLNNAQLIGNNKNDYKCYETIRTFCGSESEQGFINVHVAMVAQTPELLLQQQEILSSLDMDNRKDFNDALQNHYSIFSNIINTLQTMWKASNYSEYLSFRTFIMGQKGNKLCYPDETIKFLKGDGQMEKYSFRGETGAQDSIIPSIDNLLGLEYPKNKLTEYLFDLRSYRPKDHQAYINFVGENSKKLNFKEYVLKDSKSCILLLKNLNCLRMFRKKHWNLTKKYIIENTKHPVATGGTPITTWLPNQLGATLAYMNEIVQSLEYKTDLQDLQEDFEFYTQIKLELSDHIQSIMDEVNSLQKEFKEQNHEEYLKT